MKITAVHVDTLELEYEEPFVIASSALAAGPCDLVRVETDEGLVGYGEACPAYEFTGETLWTVQDVIGEYLGPSVVGKDPFDVEAIVRCWERELYTVGNEAARAGLEMALWDLQGKALGRPLCDLVGGRVRDGLTEVIAWGWDEPEELIAKTRTARELGITVDANQGWWDAKTAVAAIKRLEPYGIEFAEQPVRMDDLAAARFVRERVDVPIALDESVRGPREALAAVSAGACDMIVVKLMKTGGILNALKVNAIAEAAGVTVMMGNMGESSLGLAAHFHLTVALANAVHGDADLPSRPAGLKRDIGAGLHAELRDGVSVVVVPDAPGLGISVDQDAVDAQRVSRRW